MTTHPLTRIAEALERLAPPPRPLADLLANPAYLWRGGVLESTDRFAPLPLDLLTGLEPQKQALLENCRRLSAGFPAHDVLLWGARGTGKSALVKAAVGAVQAEGGALAIVETAGDALETLPSLFALLAKCPRAFVLFLDDLGFGEGSEAPRHLRSLLEGGAEARPDNVRLCVTANRRHIVARDAVEQSGALAPRDAADDKLALADRFGLSLGFHVVDQPTYLAIVEAYARRFGLPFDAADAIGWAAGRGARSGRVAWHYVVELAGRAGRQVRWDQAPLASASIAP